MAAEREVIVVDPHAQARKQFIDDMQRYDKQPIDRAKRPGGYVLNFDGSGAHDAEGRPVPVLPEDVSHAAELARMTQARFSNQQGTASDAPEETRTT